MTKKYVLSSGLRLLVEYMPHLRSVTSGIWVNCGSVYEEPSYGGVSHFLEHMLFKGTPRRDALAIAAEMEAVGGVLNAFTGKEHTCYYARSMDEHFSLQLDLLADMYINPLLDKKEFVREKKVILEELNMYEDSPDEVAMDLFTSTLYPDHPYGPPILGTLDSLTTLDQKQLAAHYQKFYNPQNSVLSIAGNIEPEKALEMAERAFSSFNNENMTKSFSAPVTAGGDSFTAKDIEQSHICLGFSGVPLGDKDYYAATIIANAFGGGASSRLFQEVREKRGLAYSAYCFLEAYVKSGFIMAYAATAPNNTAELMKVMGNQFAQLRQKGLTPKEIKQSKDQLRGNLLLNMESTANVMSKMGRTELALGRIFDHEETTARLMAVSDEDIRRTLDRMITPEKMVLAQVGRKQTTIDIKGLI